MEHFVTIIYNISIGGSGLQQALLEALVQIFSVAIAVDRVDTDDRLNHITNMWLAVGQQYGANAVPSSSRVLSLRARRYPRRACL